MLRISKDPHTVFSQPIKSPSSDFSPHIRLVTTTRLLFSPKFYTISKPKKLFPAEFGNAPRKTIENSTVPGMKDFSEIAYDLFLKTGTHDNQDKTPVSVTAKLFESGMKQCEK